MAQDGVQLASLRENIDLTSPSGKFQTTLLIALAEHERETISVRTKEKVEWRAGKGLPIGPPRHRPRSAPAPAAAACRA